MEALEKLQLSLGKLNQFSSSLKGVQNGVQKLANQMQSVFESPIKVISSLKASITDLVSDVNPASVGKVSAVLPKKSIVNGVNLSADTTHDLTQTLVLDVADAVSNLQTLHDKLETVKAQITNLNSLGGDSAIGRVFGGASISTNSITNGTNLPVDSTNGLAQAVVLDVAEPVSNLQTLHDRLGVVKAQIGSLKSVNGDNVMGRIFGEANVSAYTDAFSTLKNGLNEQLMLWPALNTKIQELSGNLMAQVSPRLGPYIDEVKAMGNSLNNWAEKYPNLAKGVDTTEQALNAMMAVVNRVSVAQDVLNVAKKHAIALSQNWLVKNLIITPLLKLKAAAVWILNGAMKAMVATGPLLMGLFTTLKAGVLSTLPAIWGFTAALLANPITWIVIGITALIASLVAMVVYWDEVSAAIGRFADWVFSALSQGFGFIKGLFSDNDWLKIAFFPLYAAIGVIDFLIGVFEQIPQWWGEFKIWLGELSLMPDMSFDFAFIETIKGAWSELKAWLTSLNPFAFVGESADWIKSKLSWLPGMGAGSEVNSEIQANQSLMNKVNDKKSEQGEPLTLPGSEANQAGEQSGVFQSISNLFGGMSKQSHVEKIEVNNYGQGVRGDELAHEMEMQVG